MHETMAKHSVVNGNSHIKIVKNLNDVNAEKSKLYFLSWSVSIKKLSIKEYCFDLKNGLMIRAIPSSIMYWIFPQYSDKHEDVYTGKNMKKNVVNNCPILLKVCHFQRIFFVFS